MCVHLCEKYTCAFSAHFPNVRHWARPIHLPFAFLKSILQIIQSVSTQCCARRSTHISRSLVELHRSLSLYIPFFVHVLNVVRVICACFSCVCHKCLMLPLLALRLCTPDSVRFPVRVFLAIKWIAIIAYIMGHALPSDQASSTLALAGMVGLSMMGSRMWRTSSRWKANVWVCEDCVRTCHRKCTRYLAQ